MPKIILEVKVEDFTGYNKRIEYAREDFNEANAAILAAIGKSGIKVPSAKYHKATIDAAAEREASYRLDPITPAALTAKTVAADQAAQSTSPKRSERSQGAAALTIDRATEQKNQAIRSLSNVVSDLITQASDELKLIEVASKGDLHYAARIAKQFSSRSSRAERISDEVSKIINDPQLSDEEKQRLAYAKHESYFEDPEFISKFMKRHFPAGPPKGISPGAFESMLKKSIMDSLGWGGKINVPVRPVGPTTVLANLLSPGEKTREELEPARSVITRYKANIDTLINMKKSIDSDDFDEIRRMSSGVSGTMSWPVREWDPTFKNWTEVKVWKEDTVFAAVQSFIANMQLSAYGLQVIGKESKPYHLRDLPPEGRQFYRAKDPRMTGWESRPPKGGPKESVDSGACPLCEERHCRCCPDCKRPVCECEDIANDRVKMISDFIDEYPC